jgi:hypothetical protein
MHGASRHHRPTFRTVAQLKLALETTGAALPMAGTNVGGANLLD